MLVQIWAPAMGFAAVKSVLKKNFPLDPSSYPNYQSLFQQNSIKII